MFGLFTSAPLFVFFVLAYTFQQVLANELHSSAPEIEEITKLSKDHRQQLKRLMGKSYYAVKHIEELAFTEGRSPTLELAKTTLKNYSQSHQSASAHLR